MLISALFVGLIFGFTAYHYFVAPYVLAQGLKRGHDIAAVQLRAWLQSLPAAFKETVEQDMARYNSDAALTRLLADMAYGVAQKDKNG